MYSKLQTRNPSPTTIHLWNPQLPCPRCGESPGQPSVPVLCWDQNFVYQILLIPLTLPATGPIGTDKRIKYPPPNQDFELNGSGHHLALRMQTGTFSQPSHPVIKRSFLHHNTFSLKGTSHFDPEVLFLGIYVIEISTQKLFTTHYL
jgi:hypothetical protein